MDLEISPNVTIPAGELEWRFSRSSGPGGQHVNTSDSRVELSWNPGTSAVLSPSQREQIQEKLASRLVLGTITVSCAEQRSQLRNRERALVKLGALIAGALRPPRPQRRATKPTRGSQKRRLAAKVQRSETKRNRQRPAAD